MSIPIVALAITVSLGALAAAASDTTSAIINSDNAVAQARQAVEAVVESCATVDGCNPAPPNCPPKRCAVCAERSTDPASDRLDDATVIKGEVTIAFPTALLKHLSPIRGTYLSDLSHIEPASFRGLPICSG